jgi:hypothetical protein
MENVQVAGKHMTVKQIKKTLKKNGLKTTGTRRALLGRMRKAHLKGGQLSTAIEEAGKTAKGVVGVGKALVNAPIEGVKAALNGKGRRGGSRKGGRYY